MPPARLILPCCSHRHNVDGLIFNSLMSCCRDINRDKSIADKKGAPFQAHPNIKHKNMSTKLSTLAEGQGIEPRMFAKLTVFVIAELTTICVILPLWPASESNRLPYLVKAN